MVPWEGQGGKLEARQHDSLKHPNSMAEFKGTEMGKMPH